MLLVADWGLLSESPMNSSIEPSPVSSTTPAHGLSTTADDNTSSFVDDFGVSDGNRFDDTAYNNELVGFDSEIDGGDDNDDNDDF